MAIATGTALALGLGASAATSLVGAKKAASASRDAARIQSQSADKALDLYGRIYQDQRQLVNPYMQAGYDSLARLMSEHWGTPLQPPAQVPQMTLGGVGMPSFGGGRPTPPPMGPPQRIGGPAFPGQPQLISVADDDGVVRQLPPVQAERALAMGFRRVT